MKYAVYCFTILLFLLCAPVWASTDEISFTSDTMQYDMEARRFYAEGNVTIKGRGMVIVSTHAIGHIDNNVFNLTGNVAISGIWNGDNVQLAAMSATAEIGAQSVYTFESGISGTLGNVSIDCEFLQIKGDNITARNVRKLQDQKAGITFSAANVNGRINNGNLTEAEAEGSIIIKGSPGKGNDIVELRGKKALYSIDRGTIVVSGGVSATQNKRTLNADSIVYFPDSNRIEAIGNSRITVNINDDILPSPSP
ncbi:MAG: hypothetical protein FWE49_03900 [Synergistaceae bacterium]|nr:hypothetical protein [Synergistaceae bacterium]